MRYILERGGIPRKNNILAPQFRILTKFVYFGGAPIVVRKRFYFVYFYFVAIQVLM
jgi:hypothetical protein